MPAIVFYPILATTLGGVNVFDFRDYRFYLGGVIAALALSAMIIIFFVDGYFPLEPRDEFAIEEITDDERLRAENGDVEAQFLIGVYYAMENRDNNPIAWDWIKKSADSGYAPAQNEVGYALKMGMLTQQRDPVSACMWFERSAEGGGKVGQYNAALCYRDGIGVDRDDTIATQYFIDSARQGYGASQFNAYLRYRDGIGVHRNALLSALAKRAATRNNFDGKRFFEAEMFSLHGGLPVFKVVLYADSYVRRADGDWGAGVRALATDAEIGEVKPWYRSEIRDDGGAIAFELLVETKEGKDEQIDWTLPQLQHALWLIAAHFGDQEAQLALSELYEMGRGVEQDLKEAAYWKQRARRL